MLTTMLQSDVLQERRELVQDVIDRLLSNPNYKQELIKLNAKCPAMKDYNRNLNKSRENPEKIWEKL